MCLGIPGKITSVHVTNGLHMAQVDFGGVLREVCVETLPEAQPGDYAIVHAGFALNLLSEAEALETLQLLREVGALEEEFGSGLETDTSSDLA